MKQRPGSGYLRAPTAVTLTATIGSTTISALTTYAAWMLGCTIRITGDDSDNELLSSTTLARPYTGSSASSIAATMYADCLTLDETIAHVLSPVVVANQWPLYLAQSREEFMRLGCYPELSDTAGYALPFWSYGKKPTSNRPMTFFVEGFYDSTLDYLPRRLRVSPMPAVAMAIGYTAIFNPIRIAAADITTGTPFTDPGVKLPIPNGWVESIFIPIARQHMTGLPKFKNEQAKPEIARGFKAAMARLKNSRGTPGEMVALYPR